MKRCSCIVINKTICNVILVSWSIFVVHVYCYYSAHLILFKKIKRQTKLFKSFSAYSVIIFISLDALIFLFLVI